MATFTADEQACISTKIETLIAEGKERDQAIAIAVSACAPSKTLNHAAPLPTKYSAVPFGNRGRFVIKDFPVFADHERTFPQIGTVHVDLYWQIQASQKSASQAAGKYYVPANELHNKPNGGATPTRLGFMVNPRVGPFVYQGKPRWVTVADVVADNKAAAEQILKFPYRSPEIASFDDPEFAALSFLDHEPPFFQWPVPIPDTAYESDRLAMACYSANRGYGIVSDFRSANYEEKPMLTDEEKKAADEKEKSKKFMGAEGSVPSVEDRLGALESGLAECLAAIKGLAPKQPEAGEEKDTALPVASASAANFSAGGDAVVAAAVAGAVQGLDAKYSQEIERRLKPIEEEHRIERCVSGLRLAAKGKVLGDGWEKKAASYARQGDAVFAAYQSTVLENAPKELPTEGSASESGSSPSGMADPAPVAAAVAKHGAGVRAEALRLYAAHQSTPQVMRNAVPVESYINNHLIVAANRS